MSSDQLVGMDGQEPAVITNAPFGAVTQPVRQATSKDVSTTATGAPISRARTVSSPISGTKADRARSWLTTRPGCCTRPGPGLPPRQLAVPWIAVAALAAAAWAVTVALARHMGSGPGTMGLALVPFLGLWVLMMAAMMLPSVAPVAVLWTRLIGGASAGAGRAVRMSAFLAGYLLTWARSGRSPSQS